jgi:hypothetical protein
MTSSLPSPTFSATAYGVLVLEIITRRRKVTCIHILRGLLKIFLQAFVSSDKTVLRSISDVCKKVLVLLRVRIENFLHLRRCEGAGDVGTLGNCWTATDDGTQP